MTKIIRCFSGRHFLGLLALTAVFTSGCQKNDDSEATFTKVYTQTLTSMCMNCHIPGGSAWNDSNVRLDFSTQATAYNTLTSLNASGATSVGTCGTVPIVTAGSPQASYLIGVLVESYSTPNFAGVSGCTPISDHILNGYALASEQETILKWIQNGAKND